MTVRSTIIYENGLAYAGFDKVKYARIRATDVAHNIKRVYNFEYANYNSFNLCYERMRIIKIEFIVANG